MSRVTRVRGGALQLGSNVVELLLPQRRPMLMVDRVEAFDAGPPATLHASRHISANEIFFEGHFPGMHLWPGCLTIEGMGQTSALLIAVLAVRDGLAAAGEDPDRGLDELRNLDLGFRMHPGYRADDAARFLAAFRARDDGSVAAGAVVDVKLVAPVFAGQRLDYRATLARNLGDMMRFDVEASIGDKTVAAGTMTGVRMRRPMPPPPARS